MGEMRTLSVRQPWAWAIACAGKTVENRTRGTRYRGLLAIHASKTVDRAGLDNPLILMAVADHGFVIDEGPSSLGAVIAVAELRGCHGPEDCLVRARRGLSEVSTTGTYSACARSLSPSRAVVLSACGVSPRTWSGQYGNNWRKTMTDPIRPEDIPPEITSGLCATPEVTAEILTRARDQIAEFACGERVLTNAEMCDVAAEMHEDGDPGKVYLAYVRRLIGVWPRGYGA